MRGAAGAPKTLCEMQQADADVCGLQNAAAVKNMLQNIFTAKKL
jgi:hypothetical protein